MDTTPDDTPEFSFVVIGYNEGPLLGPCLRSVRECALPEGSYELLYVDGGSTDGSAQAALDYRVDQILGGERRRRAAENRNLGLRAARGAYVQFLDGDMRLHPGWPLSARRILEEKPDVACVFGQLEEHRRDVFFRALQLDWEYPEGESDYCGGAALWRREPLLALGGFPEDVAYGEEPLLCWRLRNEAKLKVWHMHRVMATHDLGFVGFRDYWRRNVRSGEAFAEIADRCAGTVEPFWSEEVASNLRWGTVLLILLLAAVLAPGVIRAAAMMALLGLVARKTWQTHQRIDDFEVSLLYGVHTYLAKLGIAYGIARWQWRRRGAAKPSR